ncbi:MAG: transcription repressor NadR [Clostridiales Family XIII bacterium]|jgi:transcriptional regulator of NAD metabolism|nr:transcription repressor NadR [Clostridiales Family XIII bacterium]
MNAKERRAEILAALRERGETMSAAALAARMRVSRQVIVGDIALLRAQGNEIIATARGYVMASSLTSGRYLGKVACRHSFADTERELAAIVALGGEVVDVTVTHRLYGDMTGRLNISTREDVDAFMRNIRSSKERLLSELTDGVHLHTVACRDRAVFEAVCKELGRLGILLPEL